MAWKCMHMQTLATSGQSKRMKAFRDATNNCCGAEKVKMIYLSNHNNGRRTLYRHQNQMLDKHEITLVECAPIFCSKDIQTPNCLAEKFCKYLGCDTVVGKHKRDSPSLVSAYDFCLNAPLSWLHLE